MTSKEFEESHREIRPDDASNCLIASGYINLVYHTLGGSAEIMECLVNHGITEKILSDPAAQVDFDKLCLAVFDVMRMLNMPNAGLSIGEKMHISTHGTVGMAVISSATVGRAIDDLARYYQTRITFCDLNAYYEGSSLIMELTETHHNPELQATIVETMMLALQNAVEFVSGRPLSDSKVLFAFPPPEYAEQYDNYFSGDVEFNADKHTMILPAALCKLHCITADQQIHRLAEEQLQQKLQEIRSSNLTVQHILALMRQRPSDIPGLEELADVFSISSRTLIRYLQAQNTNYRELRNIVHKQMAMESLRNTDNSVESLALDLGYKDTASFRRAFKRWCGCSPSEYRDSLKKGLPGE